MGRILAGALGASVSYVAFPGAPGVARQWIVRVFPEDSFPGDRPLQSEAAELRAPRHEADEIVFDAEIVTQDGKHYRIGARLPTSNPASDALVAFELREVHP